MAVVRVSAIPWPSAAGGSLWAEIVRVVAYPDIPEAVSESTIGSWRFTSKHGTWERVD